MKQILVTGGAGFIGSHTVVELIGAGYQPIIVDDFSNSEKSVIDRLKQLTDHEIVYYEGKFQDKDLLAKIFGEHQIEGVIHFAAYKAVGESVEKPLKYYENNVAGLISLLEFLESRNIASLVFSSSCTVYGNAKKLPLTEESEVQAAASPYGATKQIGEEIIRDTTKASRSLRSIALRYFNPIGAHPSALIGELPRGVPSILVPFITQAVAGWRDELTVFGDDYSTPDGTCIRDYIQKPTFYDVFNVGTGKGSSVLEVIRTFETATGQKVPYKIGPRRPGDIITNYADATKAKETLNWQAEKTLADALVDAWRWQQALTKNT
jgi:UDP-glucose 4-epimerase